MEKVDKTRDPWHKNCKRPRGNGNSNKGMIADYKTRCGKSYAMKWARDRHNKQYHKVDNDEEEMQSVW